LLFFSPLILAVVLPHIFGADVIGLLLAFWLLFMMAVWLHFEPLFQSKNYVWSSKPAADMLMLHQNALASY